jgi:DNA-binding MarR family transcriptional regulator
MQNPSDARSVIISLTEKGFVIIDSAVTDHVATLDRLTSVFTVDEQDAINLLLKKFLQSFED